MPEVDFELDKFDADEQVYRDFYLQVAMHGDMLIPLAEHHTANGVHSYYVLFDRTATWGYPGMSQYIAVHLQRDRDNRTFEFEQARLPLPAMAHSWLIHRGCPATAVSRNTELGPSPADEATWALEQRLVSEGNHHAMGYSYTSDDPDDIVTVVVLRALNERAPSPYRTVVEEYDHDARTYTLREGGFTTAEEALQWCHDRLTGEPRPLPPIRSAASIAPSAALPKGPAPRPPGRAH